MTDSSKRDRQRFVRERAKTRHARVVRIAAWVHARIVPAMRAHFPGKDQAEVEGRVGCDTPVDPHRYPRDVLRFRVRLFLGEKGSITDFAVTAKDPRRLVLAALVYLRDRAHVRRPAAAIRIDGKE